MLKQKVYQAKLMHDPIRLSFVDPDIDGIVPLSLEQLNKSGKILMNLFELRCAGDDQKKCIAIFEYDESTKKVSPAELGIDIVKEQKEMLNESKNQT